MNDPTFPRFRPVADTALLVEFGEVIDDAAYAGVIALDTKLTQSPFPGFREAVPAYVSLLITFDPMLTDHADAERALRQLLTGRTPYPTTGKAHIVDICYDADLAPDLADVAAQTGIGVDAVINAHLAGRYHVAMYGFAPGYAYLSGVPQALHLPRKPAAKRGVPAGSVIIAGAQCLITTLTMPTGWWIIGRSPTRILRDDPARPFLFDVADQVRFQRISRAELEAGQEGG